MKIVIVNGSARKGNTLAATEAFSEDAKAKNEITKELKELGRNL